MSEFVETPVTADVREKRPSRGIVEGVIYGITHGKEVKDAKETLVNTETLLSRIDYSRAVADEAHLGILVVQTSEVRAIAQAQASGILKEVSPIDLVGLAGRMNYYQRQWEESGILVNQAGISTTEEDTENPMDRRRELAEGLSKSLEAVKPEFRRLKGNEEGDPVSFADQIISLSRALEMLDDTGQDEFLNGLGLDPADVDPRLLDVVQERAEQLFTAQRVVVERACKQYASEQRSVGDENLDHWAKDLALELVPEPTFSEPAINSG